jgi:inosose dehydratase
MGKIKIGYAIWPWGLKEKEQMVRALKDIKEIGYTRFESVRNAIDVFNLDADSYKAVTDEYGVYPVSFYFHQTGNDDADVDEVKRKVSFMKKNKVHRMSVQAGPRKKDGPVTEADLRRVLKTCGRIAEITKEYDIIPCIHPHANTTIMYEKEIDFIMQNSDPDLIAFGPDTAHLVVGECDPVEIFRRYSSRIKIVHLKDIMKNTQVKGTDPGNRGFEVYSSFLELGNGNVDLKGVIKVLVDAKYDGYVIAELDKSRYSNMESARINMEFLKTNIDFQTDK